MILKLNSTNNDRFIINNRQNPKQILSCKIHFLFKSLCTRKHYKISSWTNLRNLAWFSKFFVWWHFYYIEFEFNNIKFQRLFFWIILHLNFTFTMANIMLWQFAKKRKRKKLYRWFFKYFIFIIRTLITWLKVI